MNNYIYSLGVLETLQEWSDKLEAWIVKNYGNPLLWVGILVVAFLFFKVMFGTLNKD